MDTKRVFIAVVPPENIIHSLARTVSYYKKEKWGKDVKWVKPENLHLTLKFIGQLESNKMAKISSVVESALEGFGAFPLEISKLLVFPTPLKPKILSAGTGENSSLIELAESIETSLLGMGIPKEKRRFKGHITLGRCKKLFAGPQKIKDKIKKKVFFVNEIVVFQSVLRPDGPEYIIERKVNIG